MLSDKAPPAAVPGAHYPVNGPFMVQGGCQPRINSPDNPAESLPAYFFSYLRAFGSWTDLRAARTK